MAAAGAPAAASAGLTASASAVAAAAVSGAHTPNVHRAGGGSGSGREAFVQAGRQVHSHVQVSACKKLLRLPDWVEGLGRRGGGGGGAVVGEKARKAMGAYQQENTAPANAAGAGAGQTGVGGYADVAGMAMEGSRLDEENEQSIADMLMLEGDIVAVEGMGAAAEAAEAAEAARAAAMDPAMAAGGGAEGLQAVPAAMAEAVSATVPPIGVQLGSEGGGRRRGGLRKQWRGRNGCAEPRKCAESCDSGLERSSSEWGTRRSGARGWS